MQAIVSFVMSSVGVAVGVVAKTLWDYIYEYRPLQFGEPYPTELFSL